MSDSTPSSRRIRTAVIAVLAVVALVAVGLVVAWQVTGAASIADLLMKFKPGGF